MFTYSIVEEITNTVDSEHLRVLSARFDRKQNKFSCKFYRFNTFHSFDAWSAIGEA